MMETTKAGRILARAAGGGGITPTEALLLFDPQQTALSQLLQTADTLTRRVFGYEIELCAIYPAKVGRCSGDCAFCAQSVHHTARVTSVAASALDARQITAQARELARLGVRRFSLVTAGESLTEAEFERILQVLESLQQTTPLSLCASLGRLTPARAQRLKRAGVRRYHHNLETSRSHFPRICTTHSYDDKLATINIARRAGLEICCGGILGLGETARQRVELAFALKELDVDSIPLNILNPIPGTRLERQKPLPVAEILRTIAVFRLIMPAQSLKFAGGRERALGADEPRGYAAGINSALVGHYLTTPGKALDREMANLTAAGLLVRQSAQADGNGGAS